MPIILRKKSLHVLLSASYHLKELYEENISRVAYRYEVDYYRVKK
jgi:hypothetical protein